MNETVKLRRFWDVVRVVHNDQGYQILLDERPVKLPKKNTLYVQSKLLAEKIADEWENAASNKGDPFSFNALPMTCIAGTMIEKIAPDRETYISVLLPYVNGDLLCYHTDKPQTLAVKQQEKWLPLLKWIEEKFEIELKIQKGIMPITQDPKAIEKFKNYLTNLDNTELTFFAILVPILGSIFLTIALKEARISETEAFDLAYLDETTQAEIWGQDKEQQEKLERIKKDIQDTFIFYTLSRS